MVHITPLNSSKLSKFTLTYQTIFDIPEQSKPKSNPYAEPTSFQSGILVLNSYKKKKSGFELARPQASSHLPNCLLGAFN